MREIGKSTLKGQRAVLVGYGNERNPQKDGHYIAMSIYKLLEREEEQYVLCLSEGPGSFDPGLTRRGLELALPLYADHLIPYAARFFGGELAKFKAVLLEAYPKVKWQWRKE
jgi:hypothetical protein